MDDDRSMTRPARIRAGVLIGGSSRRMGQCKALLPWHGQTIVERVVQTAQCVADECVLLGTMKGVPPALGGIRILPDIHPHIGPLAGLHALLSDQSDGWSFLLSCDIPDISTAALIELVFQINDQRPGSPPCDTGPKWNEPRNTSSSVHVAAGNRPSDGGHGSDTNEIDRRPAFQAVAYALGDRVETCCALYHASLLPDVERRITHGRYALQELIQSHPHKLLNGQPHRWALRNVNTPQDYSAALESAGGERSHTMANNRCPE